MNTAMMQVSKYHKQRGDHVERYSPLFHHEYDRIYAFSIFDYTPKHYVSSDMICGGTGFEITSRLPPEIEQCEYDWSLFPDCDFSIVWFSRGCIRNCPFCVVRQKEGYIHTVKPANLNTNGTYIKVMDNNFFANPKWPQAIEQLKLWNQPVDLQGVDVRLLNRPQCEALNSLQHKGQIHIAWDRPKEDLRPQLRKVTKHIKPYKLMCYVLIGYDSSEAEDLWRVRELHKLGIDPFAAPYDKSDTYQKNFARWVNQKAIFKTTPWEEYDPLKSFMILQSRKAKY